MSQPRRLVIVGSFVLGVGLASAMASSSDASAAAPRVAGVQVLRPRSGAVVLGHSARIAVRVPVRTRSLNVRVGPRTVRRAFVAERGARVARLGIADGLRYGRNTVYVGANGRRGRRYGEVSFVLARPARALLDDVRVSPAAGAPGHARIDASLSRADSTLWVRINGERPVPVRGGARRGRLLDGDEGLRGGPSTVRVFALDRRCGAFARRVLRVVMPRAHPIPAAGPSVRTVMGATVRADARRSLAAVPGAQLSYRWQIVRAPAGSRARLRTNVSARPRLRPDRPGRYRLRVRVLQLRRPRFVGFAAQAGPGPSSAASVDETTVTVGASVPPVGLPIDTIATQGNGAGVSVPGLATTPFFPATAGNALQLVVLDRTNQGGAPQNTPYTNDAAGAQKLLDAVQALTSSSLVIITKPIATQTQATSSDTQTAAARINHALNAIGVADQPPAVLTGAQSCTTTGRCSAFSAVGVPGLPVGQGDVNPGLGGASAGDLHGFLQLDSSQNLAFTNRERVVFDTTSNATPATPTPPTVAVTVGAATYASASLAPGAPGFYVLVLDAGSLAERDSATYTESTVDLNAMHQKLATWAGDPTALVVVQSIGPVGRDRAQSTTPWDLIAADLKQLGGSDLYFQALSSKASNQFAQVGPGGGPAGYPSAFTQIATPDRSGSGRLTGLLARDRSSRFFPDDARQPGQPLAGTMAGLISMPTDTTWPLRDGAHDNELQCVADSVSPALTTPIESTANYAALTDWSSYVGQLAGLVSGSLAKTAACQNIDATKFAAVKNELRTEWGDLSQLYNLFITNMRQLYTSDQSSTIYSVANDINTDVQTQGSTQSTGLDVRSIAGDVAWIVGSYLSEGTAAVLVNIAAGGLDLASDLQRAPAGQPTLTDITTSGLTFAHDFNQMMSQTVQGLNAAYSIFATDPSKLALAAANAQNSPGANSDWKWTTNPDTFTLMSNALELAAARGTASTLFPLKWGLYRVLGADPHGVDNFRCTVVTQRNSSRGDIISTPSWLPFGKTPQYSGWPIVTTGGAVEQWVYAGPDERFLKLGSNNQAPTVQASFPGENVLQQIVVKNTDVTPNQRLFAPLSFALEAYRNGATTQTGSQVAVVQHVSQSPSPESNPIFCTVKNQ